MEHKIIQGGEEFLPFARSRIKALRATGLVHASNKFEIGGSSVKITIAGEHDYIHIEGGGVKILSGAVKGGTLVDLPIPPGSPSGTVAAKALRAYKPTANAWSRFIKDPLTPVTSFNDEEFLGKAGTQYALITPSLYSGRMAKAVAIIMGMGQAVVYDYHWAKCHGITQASDGQQWLIEISLTEGILAMPLPKTKGNSRSKVDAERFSVTEFGGIPANTSFPTGAELTQAITDSKVYRLKTVAEMALVFDKTPYCATMGWSFNDNGTEAHNTCYSQSGATYTGHHYKIALSIDTVGGVTTATATLSLVSEGPLTAKQQVSGGPYIKAKIAFFNIDTGVQYNYPAQAIDFATVEATFYTPLIACHINGVLDVVGYQNVPALTYVYTSTGTPLNPGLITEVSTPAGKHMRYAGFNPLTDGFYVVKSYDSVVVATADDFDYNYAAFATTFIARATIEGGGVTWGRGARDAYTVFRPKATRTSDVRHSSAFQGKYGDMESGTYGATISGGQEVVPWYDGNLYFTYVAPVTVTEYPVEIVIRNGVVPLVESDASLWSIAVPRVMFSVFGTPGQVACTDVGYSRFVGTFLDISDPSPAVDYTFIGYVT